MTCSINLVPEVRLHARARVRRRMRWLVAAGLLASINLLIGLGHLAMYRSVQTSTRELEFVQGQRGDVERRLLTLHAQRDALLEQLERALRARQLQPWPGRLVRLHEIMPEGVFLTTLSLASEDEAPESRGLRTVRPAGTGAVPANETRAGGARVELRGFAVDHPALLQFLQALRELPDWRVVELIRAEREPFGSGAAVAFDLLCQPREGSP